MDKMVIIEDLHKSFGALEVLKGISLSIDKGEVVALVGRSGSGKSTLLRCLNGLEDASRGTIEIAGHRVEKNSRKLRELRKDVGIVFQGYNLFPHMNVIENVMLAPVKAKNLTREAASEIALQMLGQVGLVEKSNAYPDQLSGGQQQRVAIARSLAMQPKVMLFDEVTSALDPELTTEVLAVMEDLANDGMTMVLVTHEMAFARKVAHNTVFMHHGLVHEYGSSESLFSSPNTTEFKQFLGKSFE